MMIETKNFVNEFEFRIFENENRVFNETFKDVDYFVLGIELI